MTKHDHEERAVAAAFPPHVLREYALLADGERGILVGRPFPPMDDYLRVSVGNADEMARFLAAFKEILPVSGSTATTKPG